MVLKLVPPVPAQVINTCGDCPFADWEYVQCTKNGGLIISREYGATIPYDCPLEDVTVKRDLSI